MKLNIPALGQRDSRWKDKLLGTSSISTIGNFGCLLTCAAMVCKYFGKDTDPARLNDAMVKVKGFYNGSYWGWGSLDEVYPDITLDLANDYIECYDTPTPLSKIDELLNQRIPVIVKVDFSPEAGIQDHFVLIVGKESDYLINDPWTSETYWFTAKYGDPARYIFKIVAYRGPVETKFHLYQGGVEIKTYDEHPDDKIGDLEIHLKTANDQLAGKVLEADGYREELRKQEADNADLSNQLNTARQERNRIAADYQIAVDRIRNLETSTASKDQEIKRLTEALATSQGQSISDIPAALLVEELIKRVFHKK